MYQPIRAVTALAAAATAVFLAAPAQADNQFVMCPSGRDGVASDATTCAFADNVRRAYFSQGGGHVIAYSPVTDQVYDMACIGGFTAHFYGGETVVAVKCFGGNNAEVVIW